MTDLAVVDAMPRTPKRTKPRRLTGAALSLVLLTVLVAIWGIVSARRSGETCRPSFADSVPGPGGCPRAYVSKTE